MSTNNGHNFGKDPPESGTGRIAWRYVRDAGPNETTSVGTLLPVTEEMAHGRRIKGYKGSRRLRPRYPDLARKATTSLLVALLLGGTAIVTGLLGTNHILGPWITITAGTVIVAGLAPMLKPPTRMTIPSASTATLLAAAITPTGGIVAIHELTGYPWETSGLVMTIWTASILGALLRWRHHNTAARNTTPDHRQEGQPR